ncbi:BMP family ABC transporter substrate-binding protein [Alkalicoccus urumqiensis]|uniref:ABC transporter substrate-binding protein PnrA-like domain-containing protein n=1 Tax=Alkalicoccus urumqiensis TaxID=1548213 RepID=A0A2P6ML66_ALKUR|nr:BMP family ABC transporter substrate-binding protein [Alkalicoccus urumqiensis]PRO67027.1 hypothetical protein C6I21_00215 [Alkalicoccus urumqiensis]
MSENSRQPFFILCIGTAAMLTLLLLLYLSSTQVLVTEEEEEGQVTAVSRASILTSDQVRDQSWGSQAYEAKVHLEEKASLQVELFPYLERQNQVLHRIDKEAEAGTDIIIGHGREFAPVFSQKAADHPELRFVSIHGETEADNHTVYTFDITEAEISAFIAASVKSETKKIGVLDVEDDWEGREQIEAALQELSLDVEIIHKEVQDRNDKEKALAAVEALREAGADVIYSRGNTFNRYVMEAARKDGFYTVGFISDQSYLAENHVLTSVVIDMPAIYERIIEDASAAGGLSGTAVTLTEADGAYSTAPFGPMFSEEEQQFIQECRKKLSLKQKQAGET